MEPNEQRTPRDRRHDLVDKLIGQLTTPLGSDSSTSNQASTHCVDISTIEEILPLAKQSLLALPSLIRLPMQPMNIVGDIQGQFDDLLSILRTIGDPANGTPYLFLGNYCDRGRGAVEVVMLLLAYQLKYPATFFLLRGMHESASINRMCGFYDLVKTRYGLKTWKAFNDVFNYLPIAAIIGDGVFCVHGGLSPQLRSVDDILQIRRPTDVPGDGLLCDLLHASPSEDVDCWDDNCVGVSFKFGESAVKQFVAATGMNLIVCAKLCDRGYEWFAGGKLVSVFSARNYCGEFDNDAAVLQLADDGSVLVVSFPTDLRAVVAK